MLTGCGAKDSNVLVTEKNGEKTSKIEQEFTLETTDIITSELITSVNTEVEPIITTSETGVSNKLNYANREGVVVTKEQALARISTISFNNVVEDENVIVSDFVNDDDMLIYRNALEDTTLYDIVREGLINSDRVIKFDKGYTVDEVDYITNCVRMDSPRILWYSSEYLYNDDDNGLIYECMPQYYIDLKKDKVSAIKDVQLKTEPVIAQAMTYNTEIERVKYIHDYIIYNTELNEQADYNQSAYSVLVNNEGLCASYTRAFQYYMQELGIPCLEVMGEGAGEPHSWVVLKVGGDWYEMDVMWDDTETAYEFDFDYVYFMGNREMFELNHIIGKEGIDLLPAITGTYYMPLNYEYINGSDNLDFGTSVYDVNIHRSMPVGWCNIEAITDTGIEEKLMVKDWTLSYRYYYIPCISEPAAYYVYDISYDNYYIYNEVTEEVQWFNYETGCWEELK